MHLIYQPDGNRRYAKNKGILLREAYELSLDKIISLIGWFFDYEESTELSIHALDRYNLQRPSTELDPLLRTIQSGIQRICDSEVVRNKGITVRTIGRLSDIFQSETGKGDSKVIEQLEQQMPNRRLNLLVSYDSDEELQNALRRCEREKVPITFENISERWSISPASAILRTSQLPNSTRTSAYFPGIEKARLISTQTPPQELTKEEFDRIMSLYSTLKTTK